MKKIIAILCAAIALAACTENLLPDSTDRLTAVEETAYDGDIKLNLTITRTDGFGGETPGTKAVKTGWEWGDVILVFFKTDVHKYLELKYNGSKWTATCKNGLTEDEIINASQKKLRAVHLPHNNTAAPHIINTSYNKLYHFDYFLESGIVDYTYNKTKGLTSTLRMAAPQYTGSSAGKLIDFRVTGFDRSRTYYMNMKYLRKVSLEGVYNTTLTLHYLAYGLNDNRLIQGRKDGNDLHFTGLLDQSGVGKPVTFDFTILDHTNKIAYTRSVGPKTVNGTLSVDLGDISDATKWKATQYEDLGINNADGKRIYWGVYNLGASATYPYGYYYLYGQVEGYPLQGTFGNYTCEHNFDQKIPSDFPGGRLDSNNCLTPEYDAAHAALGGAWRIPTTDEMKQLYENTNKAAVAADSESAGITYTSIKSGYENKSVFLPAAGSVYKQTPEKQGRTLLYRTSNYDYRASGNVVFNFWVTVDSPDKYYWDVTEHTPGNFSPKGLPIRPVFTLQ